MITSLAAQSACKAGELTLTGNWQQLPASGLPASCMRIWLGAPDAAHPKGSGNAATVMATTSAAQPANTGGCRAIDKSNTGGVYIHVGDPKLLWVKGTNGDAIEYAVE